MKFRNISAKDCDFDHAAVSTHFCESKIRPVAQISPSGSFVPVVNLAGVGTPDPPLTGANLPLCGEHRPPDKGSSLSVLRQ